jgi:hypothetical protein
MYAMEPRVSEHNSAIVGHLVRSTRYSRAGNGEFGRAGDRALGGYYSGRFGRRHA